jgi:hypothetical protein
MSVIKHNLDDISLDDILNGISNQCRNFDEENIDRIVRSEYPDKLAQYVIVRPDEIYTIATGDVLRYVKKNYDGISCAAVVKSIVYVDDAKRVVDFFLLSLPYQNRSTLWKIYPANHYIFRRFRGELVNKQKNNVILDLYKKNLEKKNLEKKNLEKNINQTNKTSSNNNQNVSGEQRKKLLQKAGFSKDHIDLDDKIDKFFEPKQTSGVKHIKIDRSNMDAGITEILAEYERYKKQKQKDTH